MKRLIAILAPALLVWLAGCGLEPDEGSKPAEAFVGPVELEILGELAPDAPVVATLHHGDRVEIIGRKRRFAKIRAANGAEGWTDGQLLLSPAAMSRLERQGRIAARLPSQGKVTVYDTLNVHTDPNRQAPSFYQLEEGILAEVTAHRVAPRKPYEPPQDDSLTLPLNSYGRPDEAVEGPADDWTLVRLENGRAGWVLSRMLVMAIPDEVAQYAGGRRITAYASLGRVRDGELWKHHWVWTTISAGRRPYQFDSFRVFVWSTRRHRYETAYRERNLIGYYPLETQVSEGPGGRRTVTFSLIVREEDGVLYRRLYSFSGYRVRLIEKTLWTPPTAAQADPHAGYVSLPPAEEPSKFERLLERVAEMLGL